MKIKVDHVTNSSSEVFAVVVQDSVVVGSLVAGMTALFHAHRLQFSHSDLTFPQMADLNDASAEYAQRMTEAMLKDAQANDQTIRAAFDTTHSLLRDTAQRLEDELKSLQRLKAQLDPNHPQSGIPSSLGDQSPQILFQHATDYETYLTIQINQTEAKDRDQ